MNSSQTWYNLSILDFRKSVFKKSQTCMKNVHLKWMPLKLIYAISPFIPLKLQGYIYMFFQNKEKNARRRHQFEILKINVHTVVTVYYFQALFYAKTSNIHLVHCFSTRGCSQITLRSFSRFLTTYPPIVMYTQAKKFVLVTFHEPPTHLNCVS